MSKISDAFTAYWFLHDHPKLQYRTAVVVDGAKTIDAARRLVKLDSGERFRVVKGSRGDTDQVYVLRDLRYRRPAIDSNLSIFYTKVDARHRVNKDPAKNLYTECWLEFGPIKAEVAYGKLFEEHYHDVELDCGAATFDEALVRLARLVKKHYGDYEK